MAGTRLVYQHQSKRRRRSNAGRIFYADDGSRKLYLNCAVPRRADGDPVAALGQAACTRCAFGYSELMRTNDDVCNECKLERLAAIAMRLQSEGIELGWRTRDHLNDRRRFGFSEKPISMAMGDAW